MQCESRWIGRGGSSQPSTPAGLTKGLWWSGLEAVQCPTPKSTGQGHVSPRLKQGKGPKGHTTPCLKPKVAKAARHQLSGVLHPGLPIKTGTGRVPAAHELVEAVHHSQACPQAWARVIGGSRDGLHQGTSGQGPATKRLKPGKVPGCCLLLVGEGAAFPNMSRTP